MKVDSQMLRCLFLLVVLGFLAAGNAEACTGFFINHGAVRMYVNSVEGWISQGMVLVNKRGVKKTAYVGAMGHKPAVWTSKYGSVTFNNVCQDSPNGGMNEAGLTVSGLLMDGTRYPEADERPVISLGQWKQYVLDTCATVEEVIASDRMIRIISPTKRYHVHYFVSDNNGNTAVIEYIAGKLVYYTKETMPVNVIVNDAYADSLKYFTKGNYYRFNEVADRLKNFNPKTAEEARHFAFKVLDRLPAVWGIVYDIGNRAIHFRTRHREDIKSIDLAAFDFSCAAPVKGLDVAADLSGDVTSHFIDFTPQMNRDHVKRVDSFYNFSRHGLFDILSSISETSECKELTKGQI